MSSKKLSDTYITAEKTKNPSEWILSFNKRFPVNDVTKVPAYREKVTIQGDRVTASAEMKKFKSKCLKKMDAILYSNDFNVETATITDLLNYYLSKKGRDKVEKYKSLTSMKNYLSKFNRLKEVCGDVKIDPGYTQPFRKFHNDFGKLFQEWFSEKKITAKNKKTAKTITTTTIRDRVNILNKCFDLIVEEDLISRNPMKKSDYQEVKANGPKDGKFGPRNDPNELLEVIKEHREYLYPITLFALHVPSRKNELVQARKDWLNLEEKTFTVPKEYSKNGREITKPIPDFMMNYFLSIPDDCDFVFYRKVGGTRRRSVVNYEQLGDFKKAFNSCTESAGMPEVIFHWTRKYSTTQLLKNGVETIKIMAMAGWSDLRMIDRYKNELERSDYKNINIQRHENVVPFVTKGSVTTLCNNSGKKTNIITDGEAKKKPLFA